MKIFVKTIVVDKVRMTIYQNTDAEPIEILQGDKRFQRIIDEAMPILLNGGVAEIDISQENHFSDFEDTTGGMVKLFKVAKSKLTSFFSKKEEPKTVFLDPVGTFGAPVLAPVQAPVQPPVVAPVAVPEIAVPPTVSPFVEKASPSQEQAAREALLKSLPPVPEKEPEKAPEPVAPAVPEPVKGLPQTPKTNIALSDREKQQRKDAVNSIIKDAVPAKAQDFSSPGNMVKSHETVVAVVTDRKTGERSIIPDAHHMINHMAHASKTKDAEGLQSFMERLASVSSKRQHSVDDLMKFMAKNEMPLTHTGEILAYKTLVKSDREGYYVDAHTRRVYQRVGCRVFMNEKLVDPNRSNACSNGLHIARRGYVGGFKGDVCFMVVIQPEDVIAVPEYDANKMRVAAYTIIQQLTPDEYKAVVENRPFTDNSASKQMLAKLMAGDYLAATETVEITEQQGRGLIYTTLDQQENQQVSQRAPKVKIKNEVATPLQELAPVAEASAIEAVEEQTLSAPKVDAVALAEKVAAKKGETNKGKPTSKTKEAERLWAAVLKAKSGSKAEKTAAQSLLDFKKASKKGWATLGLSEKTGDDLKEILKAQPKK